MMFRPGILLLTLLAALFATPTAARDLALSFDDAPRADGGWYTGEERTQRLIAALDEAEVTGALFFITTGHLAQQGSGRMRAYASAGHFLANHSHRHAATCQEQPRHHTGRPAANDYNIRHII